MGRHRRVHGRHRAPSTAGRTAARLTTAGVVAAAPLGMAASAQAGDGMPDNVRQAIISCESGGDSQAQSATSTASGLYQFINGTWRAFGGSTTRARDASVAEQHRVADRAFAANGTRDWEADPRSEACWRPKIGRTASTARHAKPASTYVVRRGDTLGEIAVAHRTTVAALAEANDIADPDLIVTGARLRV